MTPVFLAFLSLLLLTVIVASTTNFITHLKKVFKPVNPKKKVDNSKEVKSKKDEMEELLDRYPILEYYREFDRIRSAPEEVIGGEVSPNEDNSPIVYTFIAITDDLQAVVYSGDLEDGQEELNQNPGRVEKLTIKELLSYHNFQARIRKEKLEGAKYICEAKSSSMEKIRQREHNKRAEMKKLENAPCQVVDEVMKEIQSSGRELPDQLPESTVFENGKDDEVEVIDRNTLRSRCLKILGKLDSESFALDVSSGIRQFNDHDVKDILKNPDEYSDELLKDILDLIERAPYNTLVRATDIAENEAQFMEVLKEKIKVLNNHEEYEKVG